MLIKTKSYFGFALVFGVLIGTTVVQADPSRLSKSLDCSGGFHLSPDQMPQKLSETGLFASLENLRVCDFLIPFNVSQPLWSDGASKFRWIYLPGKIEFSPEDPWVFPTGTALVKHFELEKKDHTKVRVETRILINPQGDEWVGFTYQWQEDQKDAVLLPAGARKEYVVFDPILGEKKVNWIFPDRMACQLCHNPWSGFVLGVRTQQLNTLRAGTEKNQLDFWNENGFFTKKIESADHYTAYVNISNAARPIETRVKSYLAANCAHCHQPDSPVRASIDFRFKTPLAEMHIIEERPGAGNMGIPDAAIVKKGQREKSILWKRLETKTTMRMPPLAVSETDQDAVRWVGQWIDQMAVQPKSPKLNESIEIEPF